MKKLVIAISVLLVIASAQAHEREAISAPSLTRNTDCYEGDCYEQVCECAGKCSKATKNFINRICHQPDISVAEIDKFISAGADINAAFKIGYEGLDYSNTEAEPRQISRPVFYLSGNALRRIVEKGANIGVKDNSGHTPLMYLLRNDSDLEFVKLFLDKKAAINISNKDGETPLLLSVKYNDNVKIVELLLKHGATVNISNIYDETPLSISVKRSDEAFVKLLLENKADADRGIISISGAYHNRREQLSPLEYAAHDGNAKIVELLLKHGVKISDTRAHLIAAYRAYDGEDIHQKENLWAITRALLEKGANINTFNYDYPGGGSLLKHAISQHNLDMVKYLAEHGADLDLTDYPLQAWQRKDSPNGKEIQEYIYFLTETIDNEADESLGYLPIHVAIRKRDLKNVEKILEDDLGAAKAVDANGNSTLHVFFFSYDDILEGVFKVRLMAAEADMKPMLELLLKNGADVHAVNKNGKTPLHCAAEHGAPEDLISVLLGHSANVNARDKYGKTPLHYAKRAEAAKYLINNGADMNAVSTVLKRTPLHDAATRGYYLNVIKVLVDSGADKQARDKYGKIPFDLANNKGKDVLK